MFWRFGFHNASTIDSLLNKEDVSLESILDQDDLLQECKSQNTRLIDYFQRVDVLQRLFGYVTGQIEGDEGGRFKYPYVATEVLCSEIWSIVETCVNEHQQILAPFWETVLEKSPEEMKTQLVMASHFSKITSIYLAKKPTEMFEFLQSMPDVLGLLKHIGNPSFVDVLIRIIQLDDMPEGEGVLEWLHSEGLINRLIDLLAPSHPSDTQQIAADMLNAIIAMATPSPGAAVMAEQPQVGLASNLFARELARPEYISRLIVYIFQDFASDRNPSLADEDDEAESDKQALPKFEYASSSAVLAMGVVSELIRKNNSDYFEPYLFHTLRHRLLQVQNQQVQDQVPRDSEDSREGLERAMKEMVDRMGVVNLNYLLEVLGDRTETLMRYLGTPRSWKGPEPTTVGSIMPLTFERLRIVELFAEMLHCSNMSLLNRSTSFDHLYDASGRLQGGLSAMKDLGAVSEPHGKNQDDDMMDDGNEIEPALEFPVTSTSHDSSSLLDSDDDMSSEPGSSDDDAMEEIMMSEEPQPLASPLPQDPPQMNGPSTPPENTNGPPSPASPYRRGRSTSSPEVSRSPSSRRNSRKISLPSEQPPDTRLFVGEQLKKKFLDSKVPCKLLDLFFEYPWNNFLHSAVFDVISQMMSGPVDVGSGWNRELVISLFRDARIMYRLVEGHQLNEESISKPKGLRLGYMAHLHRLTEAVLECLTRYPPELRVILLQYAPDPGWDDYITTTFQRTRDDNSKPLGGGKPSLNSGPATRGTRWKVDEEDPNTLTTVSPAPGASSDEDETRGDFRRSVPIGKPPKNTADFGPSPMDDFDSDEDDDEDDGHDPAPHFTRYLAHQMGTADTFGSSSSSEDDDDDEGGWLSQSPFSLGNPPMTNLQRRNQPEGERRPLSASGFDDVFEPNSNPANPSNPFATAEDDDFGPFSDTGGASGTDPFTFPSSLSPEELDESSFESFGDFGDFQTADELQDGELTPTGGSWTFASDSSVSDTNSEGSAASVERGVSMDPQSPMGEKRVLQNK
ncbi:sporulation-induced protein [Marasmius tenuissimus]|nr:sporulation-induced protein [Marasmius tenuissimus]